MNTILKKNLYIKYFILLQTLFLIIYFYFLEPEEGGSGNSKVALETYLNNLPSCVNREMIDNAAVEFVVCLNTKTARRKLVKYG